MNNDWPYVLRDVHLLGGAYAVNSPEKKDKVFLFPNTFDNEQAILTLKSFGQLYTGLNRFGAKTIGTDFVYHSNHTDGSSLPEFRFYHEYKNEQWAHDYARQAWGEISVSAYRLENGHLFDLSKRIQHLVNSLSNSFLDLSMSYRNQLNARVVKKNLKVGQRFDDAFSQLIYDKFQIFLFNACILRDYLSEFVFHYVIPNEIKAEKHMTTTSRIYKKYYKDREITTEFDKYFKHICSPIGWLHKLGAYRDLVMHACPLSMPNKRAWIRLGTINLYDAKQLPRIIAPIPKNPDLISIERNKFEFFTDFTRLIDQYFDRSNDESESIDLLEYSVEVMQEFSKLLCETIPLSPIKGQMMRFDRSNIIGEVKIISNHTTEP
ncbi:hypothetical protein QZK48_02300 [Acinetobacter baumannii]|nr:hypothetical protein [Acinetobacter baumannii]